jgi:hypothetical protein
VRVRVSTCLAQNEGEAESVPGVVGATCVQDIAHCERQQRVTHGRGQVPDEDRDTIVDEEGGPVFGDCAVKTDSVSHIILVGR